MSAYVVEIELADFDFPAQTEDMRTAASWAADEIYRSKKEIERHGMILCEQTSIDNAVEYIKENSIWGKYHDDDEIADMIEGWLREFEGIKLL